MFSKLNIYYKIVYNLERKYNYYYLFLSQNQKIFLNKNI